MPRVAYAGAFLTAPGGYPVGRAWAPAATVREVSLASAHPGVAGGAATAVDEQASFGASVIKIALNAHAGPVPDAATLAAIITAARTHQLPVVAHVEGAGMARIAIEAGIDVLAHTPFSELLDAGLISRAVVQGQRWISTLDIHRGDRASRERAQSNVAAFHAAGGMILYGTDLGNGDLPVGVNEGELSALHTAGVQGEALLNTLIDPWPFPERSSAVATFVPGDPPTEIGSLPAWLAGAIVVPTEELIHDEQR
jgi:imidazolonepropionase-like amidohydrolase